MSLLGGQAAPAAAAPEPADAGGGLDLSALLGGAAAAPAAPEPEETEQDTEKEMLQKLLGRL